MTKDERLMRNRILDEAIRECFTTFHALSNGSTGYVQLVGETISMCVAGLLQHKNPPEGPGCGQELSRKQWERYSK